ncbi:MAG: hypothetical protein CMP48_14110 [Rickettsiales bacterium]|nr:hypothetical protein [Rickettsiales bacterium]
MILHHPFFFLQSNNAITPKCVVQNLIPTWGGEILALLVFQGGVLRIGKTKCAKMCGGFLRHGMAYNGLGYE